MDTKYSLGTGDSSSSSTELLLQLEVGQHQGAIGILLPGYGDFSPEKRSLVQPQTPGKGAAPAEALALPHFCMLTVMCRRSLAELPLWGLPWD